MTAVTNTPNIEFSSEVEVTLVERWGSDHRAVQAARVSTQGPDSLASGESLGLTKYLYRENHSVPFEHSGMTFLIDAPIFVTRQILKHRHSSISEESGRYKELRHKFYVPGLNRPVQQVGKTGDYQFVENTDLNDLAEEAIINATWRSVTEYQRMLDAGVAKEVARMVLPVNTYSSMYLSLNNRSLFNFIKLRRGGYGGHPQYEIALVADKMYSIFQQEFPQTAEVFELYENREVDNG